MLLHLSDWVIMGLDDIMPVKSSAIASYIKSNQKMVSIIIFCFPLSLTTNNFMRTYLLALIVIVFAVCSKEDVFPPQSLNGTLPCTGFISIIPISPYQLQHCAWLRSFPIAALCKSCGVERALNQKSQDSLSLFFFLSYNFLKLRYSSYTLSRYTNKMFFFFNHKNIH